MKMGDGGFRPAYNFQFATTADDARVIVGVEVTSIGSDHGQVSSMIDQIERRTGCKPDEHLVDGGFNDHESIEAAAEKGVTFVGPVSKPRKGDTRDPHAPRDTDSRADLRHPPPDRARRVTRSEPTPAEDHRTHIVLTGRGRRKAATINGPSRG